MIPDFGGPIWGWAVFILTVILGLALVYAVVMWSRRPQSPEIRRARDEASERVYREAEAERRRDTSP